MKLPKRVTRAACALLALLGITIALIEGAALMTGGALQDQVFDVWLGLGIGIVAAVVAVWTLVRTR